MARTHAPVRYLVLGALACAFAACADEEASPGDSANNRSNNASANNLPSNNASNSSNNANNTDNNANNSANNASNGSNNGTNANNTGNNGSNNASNNSNNANNANNSSNNANNANNSSNNANNSSNNANNASNNANNTNNANNSANNGTNTNGGTCADDDTTMTLQVGPAGGVFEAGGLALTIPAGALAGEVELAITRSTCPPSHYVAYSPVYTITPASLELAMPVVVEIAFEGPASRAALLGGPSAAQAPEVLGGTPVDGVLRGEVDGSGVFYVGNGSVAWLAEHGAAWGEWVPGESALAATDAACDVAGGGACVHGGELRALQIPGQDSCAGLTAQDTLGALEWACVEATRPVTFVSTGLRPGVYLWDLLDVEARAFRPNALVVYAGNQEVYRSPQRVWWENPVVVDDDGGVAGRAGEIVVVDTGAGASGWTLGADGVALVFRPGLGGAAGVDLSGRARVWLERRGGAGPARLASTRYSVVRGLGVAAPGATDALTVEQTSRCRLEDLALDGAQDTTLRITRASDNLWRGVTLGPGGQWTARVVQSDRERFEGMEITTLGLSQVQLVESRDLTFEGVVIAHGGDGVRTGLMGVSSSRVRLADVQARGVLLEMGAGCADFALEDVQIEGGGLRLDGVGSRVTGLRVANSPGVGVQIASRNAAQPAQGHVLRDVWLTNVFQGLVLGNYANNNVIVGLLAQGGAQAVTIGAQQPASGNILLGATVANQLVAGVKVVRGDGNRLERLAIINNAVGLAFEPNGATSATTLRDLAVSHSVREGIGVVAGHEEVRFEGLVRLGANSGGNCQLLDGLGCASPLFMGAEVRENTGMRTTFVGQVEVDDLSNPDDTAGRARYEDVTAWFSFETAERGWGPTGAAESFPDPSQAGVCMMGGSCRIYDLGVRATDDVAREARPALPGAGERVVWALRAAGAWTPAACAQVGGTLEGAACVRRWLPGVVEVSGQGDGDSLCEPGEGCLLWPNLGAYQGHGPRVEVGSVDGAIVWRLRDNGR